VRILTPEEWLKGVLGMKCILLAAGYATRLYPLTKDKPKALLTLGEKTILDLVMDKVFEIKEIDEVFIVTNHRFADNFNEWKNGYTGKIPVTVLDDGTTDNDNRLGAIGDMHYVIKNENINDDIFVLASDNVFEFSLVPMFELFKTSDCDTISAHYIESLETLKAMGVLKLDEENFVTEFTEKPQNPQSHYGVPPFYFYKKETLKLIDQYIAEGNNPDAPGYFIPWLITKTRVKAFTFDEMIIDIGTPASYEEAQRLFK